MDGSTTTNGPLTTQVLEAAARFAALAPSIHNTQPWRWRIRDSVADLYAEPARRLSAADPDLRLSTLSCGAALHHAQLALAATGVRAEVTRHTGPDDPTPVDPDHLARITTTGYVAVNGPAIRRYHTAGARYTDRRSLLPVPLPPAVHSALDQTAAAFGTGLHALRRDQIIELAAAVSWAQDSAVDSPAARAELDRWIGSGADVPMRDLGHIGTLGVSRHDTSATYVVLHGHGDQLPDWLRAGEALSAIWLTAVDQHVALLPLAATVESPTARSELRSMLLGVGYPYLVLRLGTADPVGFAAPRVSRLPADVTVESSD